MLTINVRTAPGRFDSPPLKITGWGCSVGHRVIARATMGTSRNPTIPITAPNLAPCSLLGTYERTSKYATYISQSTRVEVSLGSQVHQTPQIGLAQMAPAMIVSVVKITPMCADALAMRSH